MVPDRALHREALKTRRLLAGGSNPSPEGQQTVDWLVQPLLEKWRVQIRCVLIGIRHLRAGSRRVVVLLTRNEGGTVAARCLLEGSETPIIDGPKAGVVLETLADGLETLILARRVGDSRHMS